MAKKTYEAPKLSKAYNVALDMAARACTPDDRFVKDRDGVHVFGANPNIRLYVGHYVISDASDLLQQAVDSGDLDYDPKLRSELALLAKSPTKVAFEKLPKVEQQQIRLLAQTNARVAKAMELIDSGRVGTATSAVMDATEPVLDFSIDKDIDSKGGSMRVRMFDCQYAADICIGDKMYLHIDDECLFWGKVLTIERNTEHEIEFTCFDNIWYLKNVIPWVQSKPQSVTDAFPVICRLAGVPFKEKIPKEKYKCPARVESNRSAADILQSMLQETIFGADKQYFVRMSPKNIELVDIDGERGDDGKLHQKYTAYDVVEAMTSFNTKETVTESTYNCIQVYVNHKSAPNSKSSKLMENQELIRIQKYGMIKYTEVSNEGVCNEQLLDEMLRVLKYPTRDLHIEIVGMINMLPGDICRVAGSVYCVQRIVYRYDKSAYKMEIDMARWQKPIGDSWDFTLDWRNYREQNDKALELTAVTYI